jgi:hypothetical protein
MGTLRSGATVGDEERLNGHFNKDMASIVQFLRCDPEVFGITPAEQPPHRCPVRRWTARGNHGICGVAFGTGNAGHGRADDDLAGFQAMARRATGAIGERRLIE